MIVNNLTRNVKNEILIYQEDGCEVEVRLDSTNDTVWLSQAQLVTLFERDQSVISRHVRNLFKEGELDEEGNMQKLHIAISDKPVAFYSLDVIISVGYRVKSPQGVKFRRWATARLKEHLFKGYTLNKHRFEQNADALKQALALIEKTAQSPELTAEAGSGLVEIVSRYTKTFLWLQQLLYFVIKNHPFSDGNKRSGARTFQ